MPPRQAKRAAAKKPSPKAKGKASPLPSKPSPEAEALPAVVEKMDQKAEAPPAVSSVKVEVTAAGLPAAAQEEAEAPTAFVKKTDPEAEAPPAISSVKVGVTAAEAPAAAQEEEAPASVVKVEVTGETAEAELAVEKDQDSADPASGVAESLKDAEISLEGEEANDGENAMNVEEEGVKNDEQETGEGKVDENGTGDGADGAANVEGGYELSDGDDSGSDNEENEESDPSVYMQAPLTERKKQKEFEIFVGRLNKEAVEDDLIKVFGIFGEIQSVRIVKHPITQKSQGFGFVHYASTEHAKKAVAELKDGVKVRGKHARVSASQDNDTLYLGNICKTWTKDNVMDTLKGFGVDEIEHIHLPDDSKNEGRIKGFAFLEFSSHSDAVAAYNRLRKPDAVFGRDRSAKVAFSTSLNPSEEVMLQVKTVYIEGIPESWGEDKVEQVCKEYGEIKKVHLPRNSKKTKRNDFGFVEFTSHESAIACVEGIANAQLGEREMKMKAVLAKPQNKGRLAKQGPRGGYKVKKDGEVAEEAGQSKKKKEAKSKEVPDKGKAQSRSKNTKGNQPSNFESKVQLSKSQGEVTPSKHASQAVQHKGKKRGARGVDSVTTERPPKKARNNNNSGRMHNRPFNASGNRRNAYSRIPERPSNASGNVNYVAHPTAYTTTYAPSATSYQSRAYVGTYGLNPHHSDLQSHAGFVSAANQVRTYGNDQRRAVSYANEPGSSSGYYVRAASGIQPSYLGYPSYANYEAAYAPYPSSGAYASRRLYY